jgi:glycosyltransferase involved in cell wall biosynthesis
MVERVLVLYRGGERRVDAIRTYGARLAAELSRRSVAVELGPEGSGGGGAEIGAWLRLWRSVRGAGRGTAVVVQYNPFSFARWGFAPWLPLFLLSLRLWPRRPSIAVMVHEPYVPMTSLRWTAMGLWQRLQLAAVRFAADAVFTSTDVWSDRFGRQLPRRPSHHLPVGSNLPDRRSARAVERRRLGFEEGTLVLAAIGRRHDTWLADYVVAAANATAAERPVALLLLGAEAPALPGLDARIDLIAPGYLPEDELSAKLAAADLFLAPLADGLSTKRSAVMAALQHGLAVVATAGEVTDAVLRGPGSGIALVPVGRSDRFTAETLQLAKDPAARAEGAAAGRRLYEGQFDWPVICERLLASL